MTIALMSVDVTEKPSFCYKSWSVVKLGLKKFYFKFQATRQHLYDHRHQQRHEL